MSSLSKLILAIALICFLIIKYDFNEVGYIFAKIDAIALVVAVALFILAWIINTIKWNLLWTKDSWVTLLFASFISQFYGLILPGQLAGEVAKAYRLGRGRKDAENIAASVLVDRIVGLVALLSVSVVGILFTNIELSDVLKFMLVALIVIIVGGLYAVSWTPFFNLLNQVVGRMSCRGVAWQRYTGMLVRLIAAWRGYLGQTRILVYSLMLGILFQLIVVVINMVLAKNLHIFIPFIDWCWIVGVVSVALLLPLSIAGIGVREVSYVGILSSLGVPAESAIALSLSIFVLTLLGAAIGGAIELYGGLKRY